MATLNLGNLGWIDPSKITPSSVTACEHPEHNPPQHITLQPGGYSWACPGCGYSVTFAVSKPRP